MSGTIVVSVPAILERISERIIPIWGQHLTVIGRICEEIAETFPDLSCQEAKVIAHKLGESVTLRSIWDLDNPKRLLEFLEEKVLNILVYTR